MSMSKFNPEIATAHNINALPSTMHVLRAELTKTHVGDIPTLLGDIPLWEIDIVDLDSDSKVALMEKVAEIERQRQVREVKMGRRARDLIVTSPVTVISLDDEMRQTLQQRDITLGYPGLIQREQGTGNITGAGSIDRMYAQGHGTSFDFDALEASRQAFIDSLSHQVWTPVNRSPDIKLHLPDGQSFPTASPIEPIFHRDQIGQVEDGTPVNRTWLDHFNSLPDPAKLTILQSRAALALPFDLRATPEMYAHTLIPNTTHLDTTRTRHPETGQQTQAFDSFGIISIRSLKKVARLTT